MSYLRLEFEQTSNQWYYSENGKWSVHLSYFTDWQLLPAYLYLTSSAYLPINLSTTQYLTSTYKGKLTGVKNSFNPQNELSKQDEGSVRDGPRSDPGQPQRDSAAGQVLHPWDPRRHPGRDPQGRLSCDPRPENPRPRVIRDRGTACPGLPAFQPNRHTTPILADKHQLSSGLYHQLEPADRSSSKEAPSIASSATQLVVLLPKAYYSCCRCGACRAWEQYLLYRKRLRHLAYGCEVSQYKLPFPA